MLPISRPSLPPLDDYVELLRDIWQSRMLSNFAKYAERFEAKVRERTANPQALAVASGDMGLVLSLAALDLPEEGECLVPSFTFNSTINAVVWNRLRPVFIDIDPETFNVDLDDVERRLGEDTVAIVVTHVFGSPLDLRRLLAIARRHDLPTVIDAAHAFGGSYDGLPIGHPDLGTLQVFSFSGTKQVTSAEGGVIAPASEELHQRLLRLRGYGFRGDYVSHHVGLNGKLSELHAALAVLTVDTVAEAVESRERLVTLYRERLESVAGLRWQRHLEGARPAHKDLPVRLPRDRDGLARHLEAHGVQTKKYFLPLHTMPAYAPFRHGGDDLADTEALALDVLCLPLFNDLRDEDVERVCDLVGDYYR